MDRTLPRPLIAAPASPPITAFSPELVGYHEIRSPLSLISTLARSANVESDPELISRYIASIGRVADRTLGVIAQMFDDPVTPAAQVGLERLTSIMVEDHRIAGRALEFSCSGPRVCVASDARSFLEALLQTLLANAFDHGDPIQPVRLALTAHAETVQILVRNEIASTSRPGSGLGTSIADSLIARFGGSLTREQNAEEFTVLASIPTAKYVVRLGAPPTSGPANAEQDTRGAAGTRTGNEG